MYLKPQRRCAVVFGLLFACGLLRAQQDPEGPSREDLIRSEQAAKAAALHPPAPDKAEAVVRKVEQLWLIDTSGFFPYFDSVYRGGGLTGGVGYRKFYGDNTYWEVKGLYSVLNYKLIEGSTVSRDHLNGKLTYGARAGWRDATQVPYYGLGMNTKKEDRANFRFQETYVNGNVELRPVRWLPIRGIVGFEQWNTLSGHGDEPSIETRYTPQTAPGLGTDNGYIHSEGSVGIDWRTSPGYTRKGGLYEVRFHDYHNTSGGIYSFQRLDGEVIQHLPLLRETWVLSGRARVQTTLNDNAVIPYYMLPSLGSGSDLRGYSTDRFHDRHSMVMNGELRWMPSVGWDMAIFYDAGKVTARRNDLGFKGLKSDVGIGARFHGPFATPLRLDLAVSNEGWRLVFAGSPIF
jgi:hypothetical protein